MTTADTPTHVAPFKINSAESIQTLIAFCSDPAAAAESFANSERDALKAGHTIEHADGRKVWRNSTPIIDTSDNVSGSARYEWHADGERVRHVRTEHTTYPDGSTEAVVLRRFWRVYE